MCPPHVEIEPGQTLRLPICSDETNVLYDDRGHPDAAAEEDAAIESRLNSPLVRKTRPALPPSIDLEFNIKYNEALHGRYLREHLHTGHLSPTCAA